MSIITTPRVGELWPDQGGFYAGTFRINDQRFALIVAPRDGGEFVDRVWLDSCAYVPGARSFADGLANTDAMAEAGSALARGIRRLSLNGFSDWYLPSRDELELQYRSLKPTGDGNSCGFRDGDNPSSLPPGYPYDDTAPAQTSAPAFQAGGAEAFATRWYWSSTQYSRNDAWGQDFDDGSQNLYDKSFQARARAVRRFVP